MVIVVVIIAAASGCGQDWLRECDCIVLNFCVVFLIAVTGLSHTAVQMFLGSPQSVLVPAQIAVIIWLIYASLGPATFAGLGIIFLVLPFLGLILSKLIKYHYARLGISDKRVKLSSEILQGIRILKFYGESLPVLHCVVPVAIIPHRWFVFSDHSLGR